MKPYYADDYVTLYHGDTFDVLAAIDVTADLVVADPPYNIGKAHWDTIDDYLPWSERWITLAAGLLADNGGWWCFHSDPLVLTDLARLIEATRRPRVSFITLDKSAWSIAKRYDNAGTKTFPASAEYATYHRRELYADIIRDLRRAHGLSRAEFDALISPSQKPTGLCYRWEHGERVPQPAELARIRDRFGVDVPVPIFSNPTKATAVWPFPPPEATGHPTAKPSSVVTRAVASTSVVGGLVLDPFAGSGTTLRVAKDLGRRAVGVERNERYCEDIARRLAQDVLPFEVAS